MWVFMLGHSLLAMTQRSKCFSCAKHATHHSLVLMLTHFPHELEPIGLYHDQIDYALQDESISFFRHEMEDVKQHGPYIRTEADKTLESSGWEYYFCLSVCLSVLHTTI